MSLKLKSYDVNTTYLKWLTDKYVKLDPSKSLLKPSKISSTISELFSTGVSLMAALIFGSK